MALPKLTTIEHRLMDAMWTLGPASVREIQEALDKGQMSRAVEAMERELRATSALRFTQAKRGGGCLGMLVVLTLIGAAAAALAGTWLG